MFRFVTIVPLEFWAIVLLLLFMWAAFGLGGLVITVVGLALIMLRERVAFADLKRITPRAMMRKPSCLISCSHWLPEGSLFVSGGRHGATKSPASAPAWNTSRENPV